PPPQPEIAPVQFVGVTALDVVTRAEAKPYAADFNVFIPGVTAATKLVKFNADAWTVDGDPILVDRTGGTLVAWAPSALAVTTSASGAEYTLTAQKDAAAQDLIYQPQPVNAANAGAVAVEMKHAYSKLSFLATAGNGYTGAANLTQVQITGGIYATGTLDMVAGTVDPAGTATGALTLAAGEKALVVPMAAKPTLACRCMDCRWRSHLGGSQGRYAGCVGAFGFGRDYFCQWRRIYADGAKGCGRTGFDLPTPACQCCQCECCRRRDEARLFQTLFPGNGRQWIHGCCQSYSGADYRWNLCDRHARYGSRHGGSGRHGDGGAYPGRRRKGACRAYGR
ncbi:fimbrillin family protein, partial [Alistipes onderdonkii]